MAIISIPKGGTLRDIYVEGMEGNGPNDSLLKVKDVRAAVEKREGAGDSAVILGFHEDNSQLCTFFSVDEMLSLNPDMRDDE